MAQNWTTDCFAGGHAVQTDMQNIEDNFVCLKSSFSGSSSPANPVAGMNWYDTTQKLEKLRDSANGAWFGVMHGDVSQKMWVYRNTYMEGWAVDGTVTDKVLGLKGGATYTSGAASAGSWNHATGLTNGTSAVSGSVSATIAEVPAMVHSVSNDAHFMPYTEAGGTAGYEDHPALTFTPEVTHSLTAAAQAISSSSAWRIAAAVGTLQYMDV